MTTTDDTDSVQERAAADEETPYQRVIRQDRERNAADFEKATKIPAREYTGWVCRPDAFNEPGYGYHASVEDMIDHLLMTDDDLPPFVWATTEQRLKLDANWILENALDEHHEDARDQISDEAEKALQAFLDEWVTRSDVNVISYAEDRTRAIVFDDQDRAYFAGLRIQRDEQRKADASRWAREMGLPDAAGDET